MPQDGFDTLEPTLFPTWERENSGYRGPTAGQIAGITYRQLDYWARTGLVTPSIRPAAGSGSARLYSFTDILALKIVKRLLDAGMTLQNIRVVIDELRGRNSHDLATVTLLCDGTTVYECTDDNEVIDLLRGGQGVFAVAIGASVGELASTISTLPADTAVPIDHQAPATDELAARRARRTA